MTATTKCTAIIKHYEGFFANPYICPAGIATIGYGATFYDNGKPVRLNNPSITQQEANEILAYSLISFSAQVTKLLKVPVTQNQFDALVSFAYNFGASKLESSTLLMLINQNIMATNPNYQKLITIQFYKWVKAKIQGKYVTLPGLVARRTTESFLFTNNLLKFFN